MNKIISGIFCLFVLSGSCVFAAFSSKSAGTAGAQFLKFGAGSRAAAMGNAQTALTDDVNSIYWNPAGLNDVEAKEVSFMHTIWFQDIGYQYFAYAQPLKKGAIGCSIQYLSMSAIDKYDNTATALNETYKPSDIAVTLSYAKVVKDIPVGAGIKYIRSTIDDETAQALAIDLGGKYNLMNGHLVVGLAMQNLGTKMKFISEADPLPFTIKTGAVYKMARFGGVFNFALDLNAPVDDALSIGLGTEYVYSFNKKFTFSPRVGYKTEDSELDGTSGVTAGFGFGYNNAALDYAWTPYGELGDAHKISLLVRFNAPKKVVDEKIIDPKKQEEIMRTKNEKSEKRKMRMQEKMKKRVDASLKAKVKPAKEASVIKKAVQEEKNLNENSKENMEINEAVTIEQSIGDTKETKEIQENIVEEENIGIGDGE
ncbi:MAG: PorV/PorQ family protein [Elusimicrobiota bacterium]